MVCDKPVTVRFDEACDLVDRTRRGKRLFAIAHGYSAYVDGWGRINKKSQRYVAAEAVSERAHRLILMTATPHRGSRA